MSIGLEEVSIFKDLSKKELKFIENCLFEKDFQKGEILVFERTPCERIFIVKSGEVRLYKSSYDGHEQTLTTLRPGETCACHPGIRDWFCSSTAEATQPTKVWFLSLENYSKMLHENPSICEALNKIFANRLCIFSSLIEEVTLKNSKERLIQFFLDIAKETKATPQGPEVLQISLTREEIANRLGVSRETVSRQISNLKKSQLIDIKPHQIIILDPEGLEALLR